MFYNKKENLYVNEGTAFTLDGVQYPAVWLNQSTAEEKAAIGLEEVIATNSPADDRFYWVSQELNEAQLTYINTPKQLDDKEEPNESGKLVKTTGLKTAWKEQINNTVYTLLQPSDYMPSREFETGVPMNANWKAYRAAVREFALQSKAVIDSCTTVDQLSDFIASLEWPHDPNYVVPVEDPVIVNGA